VAYRIGTVLTGIGMALAAAGVASAQPVAVTSPLASGAQARGAETREMAAREIPWYERFTASTAPTLRFTAQPPAGDDTVQGPPASARFGLSVDSSINESADPLQGRDEASVTAFYRLSPHLQVRGKLSVAEQPQLNVPGGGKPLEPNSSVKIESVFKF